MKYTVESIEGFVALLQHFSQGERASAMMQTTIKEGRFHEGKAVMASELADLLIKGEIDIPALQKESPKPETKTERLSAANNTFLAEVRANYPPDKYRRACQLFEEAANEKRGEQRVRDFLSFYGKEGKGT
jgi:hypothetical protein